jgi:hypothetical protein
MYVLYGPKGKGRYVGEAHGINGVRGRLMTHLRESDGVTQIWLRAQKSRLPQRGLFRKYGSTLRSRGGFRYLVVENARQRALLEAYATGCLCPDYIGGSQGLP